MIGSLLARRSRIYPGWWLAVGTCVSLGLVAGMTFWSFGLFVDPLGAEFGWSRSVLGAAVSLSLLASGAASPLVGQLVDRLRPRRVILIGTVATALGYVLLAQVRELWEFVALMAALAFFRTWIFYVPFTTLITRWFSRRRATAMGIATSGFGLGGLLFLPLMTEVLAVAGWRATFLVSGVLVLAINGLFVALTRDDPPAGWSGHEAGEPGRARARPGDGIYRFDSRREIYRAPVFWATAGGFALFFFAQWAFLYQAPQVLEHGGLAARDAALVMGASGGLGVLLRLGSGAVLDRLVRLEALAAAVLAAMALALAALASGTSAPALAAFALLWGVGSGLGPALEPMLVLRFFGSRHYGPVYGTMDGVDTVVSIPGPWLGGIVYDRSGSYLPVLALYAVAFAVGGLGFWFGPRLAPGRTSARTASAASVVS